jgi:hypothetical protein
VKNKKKKSEQEKVVIVRLIGGIGNQLYQLQKGITLSRQLGYALKIDASYYNTSKKQHEKLAINNFLSDYPVIQLSRFDIKVRRYIERILVIFGVGRLFESYRHFIFEKEDLNPLQMSRIILDGFWQGANTLDDEFLSYSRMVLQSQAENIVDEHRVCVHIRRGDYLSNRNWLQRTHIVIPLSYYVNAFQYFRDVNSTLIFDVYSDDEEWAINVFKEYNDIKVIKSSEMSPFKLLLNMSSYKQFIIGNSTLSWWAAVLSNFPYKKVIMPSIWGINTDSQVYKCDEWFVSGAHM